MSPVGWATLSCPRGTNAVMLIGGQKSLPTLPDLRGPAAGAISGIAGLTYSKPAGPGSDVVPPGYFAKGERGWSKKRGDDPLWDEDDVEVLKKIEKEHPNAKVRENAKKIRKMKEKTKGKPCN